MRRPRLYVDVSVIARHDAGTGIQRVVRGIWQALMDHENLGFDVVPVAGSSKGPYRAIRPDFLENPLQRLPWPYGRARIFPRPDDMFLGLDLSSQIAPRNSSQLRRWRERGVKLVFVVYDLLPVLQPAWFTVKNREHYRRWIAFVCQNADVLACISHNVAQDLGHFLEASAIVPPPQIATIRLGGLLAESKPSTGVPTEGEKTIEWVRKGTCVMMVGTIEPRKGYDQALAAFEELWEQAQPEEDFRLLIVGRPGWHTEGLQQMLREHRLAGERLRWISNASDEYLGRLYQACWGVLNASRGEGFGLPVLEAAAWNKPILARDLPVFREVAPAGTDFFDDGTAVGLAEAIRNWRRDGKPTKAISDNLSWSKAAADLKRLLSLSIDRKVRP